MVGCVWPRVVLLAPALAVFLRWLASTSPPLWPMLLQTALASTTAQLAHKRGAKSVFLIALVGVVCCELDWGAWKGAWKGGWTSPGATQL